MAEYTPGEILKTFNEIHDVQLEVVEDKLVINKIGADSFIANNYIEINHIILPLWSIQLFVAVCLALCVLFVMQNSMKPGNLQKMWDYKKE